MSLLTRNFLQEKGYNTKLAYDAEKNHMFVAVDMNSTWAGVEATCDPLNRLGCVQPDKNISKMTVYLEGYPPVKRNGRILEKNEI